MSWYVRLPLAVAFCVLLLGGCPLGPLDDGFGGAGAGSDTPSSSTPGGDDGGTTGGSTVAGGQSFSDHLEDWFPGCAEPASGQSWRVEVLQLINDERSSRGLPPLAYDATLENQANQYACEMIYYDFFAHENPVTGTGLPDRADDFGYEYTVIGENLAAGQQSPVEVVRDWMDSPGHRDNVLEEEFTEAGVGVRDGGQYRVYWVVEFGCPR